MNITEKENSLFQRWKEKPGRIPFVLDGSPCPSDYLSSKVKISIVLKDANLGDYQSSEFDLRTYLINTPDSWWKKVAAWCYVLRDLTSPDPKREGLDDLDIIENLKPFVFIQLKKQGGYGSVSIKVLKKFAREDKQEIAEQFLIYRPQIIICGGVGSLLSNIFDSNDYHYTPKGIRYWIVNLDGNRMYLVDYCHPSIRASNKIISSVAYGLRDACIHLIQKYGISV